MKTLSLEQACYFAGFLDSDGSIMAQIVSRKDYVLLFQIRVSVTFVQKTTRIASLRMFQEELGTGTVRDRGDGVAEFAVVGHANVSALLKQVIPFLRNKRAQAELVMLICEQLSLGKQNPQKFLELCTLADQVAELNDSHKRSVNRKVVEQKWKNSGKFQS